MTVHAAPTQARGDSAAVAGVRFRAACLTTLFSGPLLTHSLLLCQLSLASHINTSGIDAHSTCMDVPRLRACNSGCGFPLQCYSRPTPTVYEARLAMTSRANDKALFTVILSRRQLWLSQTKMSASVKKTFMELPISPGQMLVLVSHAVLHGSLWVG